MPRDTRTAAQTVVVCLSEHPFPVVCFNNTMGAPTTPPTSRGMERTPQAAEEPLAPTHEQRLRQPPSCPPRVAVLPAGESQEFLLSEGTRTLSEYVDGCCSGGGSVSCSWPHLRSPGQSECLHTQTPRVRISTCIPPTPTLGKQVLRACYVQRIQTLSSSVPCLSCHVGITHTDPR